MMIYSMLCIYSEFQKYYLKYVGHIIIEHVGKYRKIKSWIQLITIK